MAFKEFLLDDIVVNIYKRKGSRSLRISVLPSGVVRVTIPAWSPYTAGLQFAKSRLDWIREHQPQTSRLQEGQAVGKAHHLHFSARPGLVKPTTRVVTGEVQVYYPASLSPADPLVQAAAEKACVRALRNQAEGLLPQRLRALADTHGFAYSSVAIKVLKSRWGSCDQHQHIVLNLYLMQLPWDAIDYVLLHELAHTVVLHHGPDFWQAMERVLPNVKRLRKLMRRYQPVMQAGTAPHDTI